MTIPGSAPFASAPYGAVPVIPVIGPEGGPYDVAGPRDVILLPSAARTATSQSSVQINSGFRGIYVDLNVTVNPGGAQTLQVTLNSYNLTTGSFAPLLTVPASAAPTGQFLLYPGCSGAAVEGITQTRNLVLPPQWFIVVTHSGVGSWTYSLVARLLP
jgi:hypothetical protein